MFRRSIPLKTWFDLTISDSYFTILAEVFMNQILAEKKYFTNRIKWTEHSIMVLNPANKHKLFGNIVISKTFLSIASTFIHFFTEQIFTGKIIETIYYCISPHITSILRVAWRKRKLTFKTVLRVNLTYLEKQLGSRKKLSKEKK